MNKKPVEEKEIRIRYDYAFRAVAETLVVEMFTMGLNEKDSIKFCKEFFEEALEHCLYLLKVRAEKSKNKGDQG